MLMSNMIMKNVLNYFQFLIILYEEITKT